MGEPASQEAEIVEHPSASRAETTPEQMAAWSAAFVQAQGAMPTIAKSRTADTGSYSYNYADLPAVLEAVRPVLAENGLAVVQDVVTVGGLVEITTVVLHAAGGSRRFGPVVLGSGNTPQSLGSAITYARRYALCAALGIAAEEDDDGQIATTAEQKATTRKPRPAGRTERAATAPQKAKLAMLAEAIGWDDDERHKRAGVASFNDLTMKAASALVEEWTAISKSAPAAANRPASDKPKPAAKAADPATDDTAALWKEAVALLGSRGEVVKWLRDEIGLTGAVNPRNVTAEQLTKVIEVAKAAKA